MGFFSTIKNTITKSTTPAKVSTKVTIPTVKGVASAITKGAVTAAKNFSKSYQKSSAAKKPNTNNKKPAASSGGSSGGGGGSEGTSESNLIQWHDVRFYANASEIRGFDGLTISGSVETEDKENGGTKYVAKKNSKGYEVSLTAFFDKRLGVDNVKKTAMALVTYGANGQTGYMYARGEKLISSILMLTSAKLSKVIMTPNGTWISCEVQITLKTCSKLDGTTGGNNNNSGSGYKYSARIYYQLGSGASCYSVMGYSNVSYQDAYNKAKAKVPSTASWIGTNPKSAPTPTQPTLSDAALEAARKRVQQSTQQTNNAKNQSTGTGITNRNNQVQQKKLDRVK